MRTVIRNGQVLTMSGLDWPKADVVIDGNLIQAVMEQSTDRYDQEIDAEGCIVMPGFIDTHRHMWQGALRNIAPNHTLDDYFRDILSKLAPVYRSLDVFDGNMVSALGALNAGVTTVFDWSHIQNTPEHTLAAVTALQQSGIRAVFGYGSPNTEGWWGPTTRDFVQPVPMAEEIKTMTQFSKVKPALAIRGSDFTSPEVVWEELVIARKLGWPISVHVGCGKAGNSEAFIESFAGLIAPDITFIHCGTLDRRCKQLIREGGGYVSLSIPIEEQMGHGDPDLAYFLPNMFDRVSLSVDVETTCAGDMFTQMKGAMAAARRQGYPLTVKQAVKMATINGARALGYTDLGRIAPGCLADIIILDKMRINVAPVNDPYGAIVHGMDTSNIKDVIVGGRHLVKNHAWSGLPHWMVLANAHKSRDYLRAKAQV